MVPLVSKARRQPVGRLYATQPPSAPESLHRASFIFRESTQTRVAVISGSMNAETRRKHGNCLTMSPGHTRSRTIPVTNR
jgi:hypothetical protein